MLHFRTIVLFLTGLISASANSTELAAPTTIRIGGSGDALATMQILGQAFNKTHPNVNVAIVPSLGSGGGIKAVLAGSIDLAISGRALKQAERAQGRRQLNMHARRLYLLPPSAIAFRL